MICELNPKHGIEVWINQKMVEEIEREFKKVLETEELYYYYSICLCHIGHKSKVKWVGKSTLINFIKKVQKVDSHFAVIGVTNASNKKDLENYLNNEFDDNNPKYWDYWIGDAVHQDLVTGDNLVVELWNRIKDKKTKNEKTRKKFLGVC